MLSWTYSSVAPAPNHMNYISFDSSRRAELNDTTPTVRYSTLKYILIPFVLFVLTSPTSFSAPGKCVLTLQVTTL